jgi:hypothetical protein
MFGFCQCRGGESYPAPRYQFGGYAYDSEKLYCNNAIESQIFTEFVDTSASGTSCQAPGPYKMGHARGNEVSGFLVGGFVHRPPTDPQVLE